MSPRICHVSQPVEAGVAQVILDLVKDQVAAGWSVELVCPQGWLLDAGREQGAICRAWPASRQPGVSVVQEVRRLREHLRGVSPDIVHLHSSKAGLAGRLALRGRLPTVFQPHAWSFAAAGGGQARAALAWERTAARWTDLQVCCSSEEQRDGQANGIRGRSVVVPNGVDLERFPAASQKDRESARRSIDAPLHAPLAVCVGRLSVQKGQDVAVRAWPLVREHLPEAQLLLVGEGPERGTLQATAGSGVHLLGHRDDVARILAAADVVLLPSRWEGMALALLEAMARGRSVVTTRVAGSESALLDGDLPRAGAVVAVDDPAGLADAVLQRLGRPELAAAEGQAGRHRVERDHDLRRSTAAIRALYSSMA